MVTCSPSPLSKPQWGENDPARRFVNRKAEYFQHLADAFEREQVEGLTDEATIGQLAGLLYEIDAQGRMKIESKEDARARGVPSPDRAEALMLVLGQPREPFDYRGDHGQSRVSSPPGDPTDPRFSAHPVWGFREVAGVEHPEDHRGSGRWPSGVRGY